MLFMFCDSRVDFVLHRLRLQRAAVRDVRLYRVQIEDIVAFSARYLRFLLPM